MRKLLVCWLLLPVPVWGWELLAPASPRAGAVAITTVADILDASNAVNDSAGPLPANFRDYLWVAFADGAAAEACRQISEDNRRDAVMTYQGRYVVFPSEYLPVALFAQAHGLRVRVKLVAEDFNGQRCRVVWFQTCSGPQSCPSVP